MTTDTRSLIEFPALMGRCDGCDGPLDVDYRAGGDGEFRVCSKCDEADRSRADLAERLDWELGNRSQS